MDGCESDFAGMYRGLYIKFFDWGIQYYVAARFCSMAKLMPVNGNLYHHAVEMLLKGQLSKKLPPEELKKRFGHNLPALWQAFKHEVPNETIARYDVVITELHRFESIRYPDVVFREGMGLISSWNRTPEPPAPQGIFANVPRYSIAVTEMDEFIGELFRLCDMNLSAYMGAYFLNEHAAMVLENENPACRGWFPERERLRSIED